jgi:hypothetical protein
MLSGKTRWQGCSVVRNHHIAGAHLIRELGPRPVLDITLSVNDQYLRVEGALDWKTSGYHPITSRSIASE